MVAQDAQQLGQPLAGGGRHRIAVHAFDEGFGRRQQASDRHLIARHRGFGGRQSTAQHPARDGTDAVADWPLLNAMLNVASGAHVGVVIVSEQFSGKSRVQRHRLVHGAHADRGSTVGCAAPSGGG